MPPCCSPRDAAASAIATFDVPVEQWTKEQTRALSCYKQCEAGNLEALEDGVPEILDNNGGSLEVFGITFFRNQLRPMVLELPADIAPGVLGDTSKPNGKVTIRIPRSHHQVQGDDCRSHSIIGTTLHEATHAYFDLVSCDGSCGNDECKKAYLDDIGMRGHGPAWQLLAGKVQQVARQQVTGFSVNLGLQDHREKVVN